MEVDLTNGSPAVLVVDVQGFSAAPDGPFENAGSGPMVAAINRLLEAARAAGLPVIHSRYVVRADRADAGLLLQMPGVDLSVMASDSPWVELDPRVAVEASDIDCTHSRPSAFFASDLDAVLRGIGVDTLILAGLSLNNAIAATARDAFARDIPVLIPRETVQAAPFEDPADVEPGFRALATWTAEVASLDAVLPRLPSRG
ncbi:MAG: cysteine hydrolase [Actinobacteria bacterium]|nr:cysteine hydrolase [Actinomycetota bacterium]